MAIISVRNLYKVFGQNQKKALSLLEKGKAKNEILKKTGSTIAINNVSFEIEEREIFVIMGLSGSGKSTLIRCLNRLIQPTKGDIFIEGENIMEMNKENLRKIRRHKLSMVFQHFGLLPQRTVLENTEFGLEISGIEKNTRRNKAAKAIELVGLNGYENAKPSQLSGGMQQRVGLARALANNPEILLMDEAFSALDPLIRTQMQDELLLLQAKMHKTIVFITHDLDEALKLGDRIAILGPDGKLRQIGTPEEILSDPADEYVKEFVQNVDRTKVITASSIMKNYPTVTYPKDGPGTVLRAMEKNRTDILFVTDSDRHLLGIVTINDAADISKTKIRDIGSIIKDSVYTTSEETALSDLMGTALSSKYPIAVIDEENIFHGVVDRGAIIREVNIGINNDAAPTRLSEINM